MSLQLRPTKYLIFFRIAIVLASLVFGGIVIYEAVDSWVQSPASMGVQDHHFKSDGKVPFPAIVVCPQQATDRYNLHGILLNR